MHFSLESFKIASEPCIQWRNVSGLTIHLVQLDVHGSVHHNINLIDMTKKMQLCSTIYYSVVP